MSELLDLNLVEASKALKNKMIEVNTLLNLTTMKRAHTNHILKFIFQQL